MNILVIGGTRYFGIHMVNKLLEQGHDITIATRGKTPDSYDEIEKNGGECIGIENYKNYDVFL